MLRLFALLGLLAALSACGTPLERCLWAADADLRALERERAERQRNLDRGYALERRIVPGFGRLLCIDPTTGQPRRCEVITDRWETVPVPINRRIEARRIELLNQLIAEERPRTVAAQSACRAAHPTG